MHSSKCTFNVPDLHGDNTAIIEPSPLLHHQPFFKSCNQGLISVVSIPDPRPHPRAIWGVYDLANRSADGLVSCSLGWISVNTAVSKLESVLFAPLCRGFLLCRRIQLMK